MIRTYLSFGSTRKRCLLTPITKIYGELSEETVEMDGSGTLRMKPTIGASILTSTKISNPSLITTVHISGNLYTRKTALKDLISSIRCALSKKYYITSSVDCTLAFPPISADSIKIQVSRVLGLI